MSTYVGIFLAIWILACITEYLRNKNETLYVTVYHASLMLSCNEPIQYKDS